MANKNKNTNTKFIINPFTRQHRHEGSPFLHSHMMEVNPETMEYVTSIREIEEEKEMAHHEHNREDGLLMNALQQWEPGTD